MRQRRSVWIVQHDESPDNTVLGVFDNAEEAREYAEMVEGDYPDGVIITCFPIGYRDRDSAVRYSR